MSRPNLYTLVDAAKFILNEIAVHPDFVTIEYYPDLTVGDAQTALSYLKQELEDNQQFSLTAEIFANNK